MGSWYKTCGVSNLHIRDNDDVMVFVLEKNTDDTDRCYSTAFWKPLMLPFYAKYGDYGKGDDNTGVGLPYIVEGIKKNLVEMELGENQYHDIAVKKDKFDIELFYEAVHENRLFKDISWGGKDQTMLDFVMIRKDIADDILANFQREVYVGGGKGDCGYENNYKLVTFTRIIEDLPEYMEKLHSLCVPKEGATNEDLLLMRMEMRGMEIFEWGHPNLVSQWMRGDNYRFCQVVRTPELIFELVKAGDIVQATNMLIDILKARYLDCFMETTRRNWAPGGHEGSQASEAHGYRIIAEATLRALTREKQEYIEDVGDEEEYSEF